MEVRNAANRIPSHIRKNPAFLRKLAFQLLGDVPEEKRAPSSSTMFDD